MKRKVNLLDLFLILLVILAALAIYFTFVKPLQFSKLIHREGVMRYAKIEILLPDDLVWMKEVLPVGEESRNVYGELDWKILSVGEKALGGKKFTQVTAKILIAEESSGILRYGKYTLVRGNKLYLINDRYVVDGRILNFELLDEQIQL